MDVYVALITSLFENEPAGGYRHQDDFRGFDTLDFAQQWADKRIAEDQQSESSRDTQADIARVDRKEWHSDTWAVDDDTIVGRGTWDSATNSVTWQTEGPYDWSDRVRP